MNTSKHSPGSVSESDLKNIQFTFANLAFSYGMVIRENERRELSGAALICLQSECEALISNVLTARASLRGGA